MRIKNAPQIEFVNKQFGRYAQQILKESKPEIPKIITSLQIYEKSYKRLGFIEGFVQQAQIFAEECFNKGLMDVTGIIYSSLIKIPNLPSDAKEALILRAIMIAQKQNDSIHELARVVDLKHLYDEVGKQTKREYMKVLFSEEKILKNIVENYQECCSNHRTISRKVADVELYEYNLGLCKIDIAKKVFKSDKKLAYKKLKEARKIFTGLDKTKELSYTEKLIYELKGQI